MANPAEFRAALQGVVDQRHQANHPLIAKWADGEVSRETIAGVIREHWYWISNLIPGALFNICAKAPDDVVEMEMENYAEEANPENPHVELLLRFCEACGMTREGLAAERGLPTTESWLNWELNLTAQQPWIAGVAGLHIASEAQEPRLFSKVLPALRETYKYSEHDLEYWWLHAEADIEHGGRAFEILVKHCDTPDKQAMALHYASEGARMKYLFWDGINLHYDVGYKLQ